ncbi:DNA polymerase III subunit [Croceiramulus getboli]|nr:DNA polymerase III subunit delta' [Flavobacteriaceae bacterium YJPT1-3]
MHFEHVIGQDFLKAHLIQSAERGRIPHAQLFIGSHGSGVLPMAIAYAQYILCSITKEQESARKKACETKFSQLTHPDLHFVYPVATTDKVKSHPVSTHFAAEWREFVKNNAYGSLYEWYQHLGIAKKQGQIGVDEAADLVKTLSLTSYEGGYKIIIIWMAEKMNTAAANKLLKLIEEPPKNSLFLLLAEEEEQILETIKSRCQVLHFPKLSEVIIAQALIERLGVNSDMAQHLAHQADGNYNQALHLLNKDAGDAQFEAWFIQWVRTAFQAKGNKKAVLDLIYWSNTLASEMRETQKNFLQFCIQFFRQALLLNYGAEELVYLETGDHFDLAKFAPYVHGNNIREITEELEAAAYHIERNGNAKIILTDLSIKLTRLLHKKSA